MTESVLSPFVMMGGTYDPVHRGHIQIALDVVDLLGIDTLHMLPVHGSPSRKQPLATPAQRLAMLSLAVAEHPALIADAREVERGGTSYTVETLEALRAQYPERSLTIVMGMDAYLSLPFWHRWRELTDFANIVVLHRGNGADGGTMPPLPAPLAEWHVGHANSADELLAAKNGRVLIKKCSLLDISSTIVRNELREAATSMNVTPAVLDYVLNNRLYGT